MTQNEVSPAAPPPMDREEIYALIIDQIPRLRRFARCLVFDRDSADDLVQECLVRAVARAETWKPETNMRAWLFAILHNCFISNLRRAGTRRAVISTAAHVDIVAVSGNQETHLELLTLSDAISRLPPDQRSVLMMVGVEGMRYDEAADVLGVPIGTVRSRLFRARETLRLLDQATPVPRPLRQKHA